jgi:hypothetical protein
MDISIVISNNQPIVYGKTTIGSAVLATFESVLTSSSIVADASLGDFAITTPTPLPQGKHQVTLYAISPEGLRSSAISLPFSIESAFSPAVIKISDGTFVYWLWILGPLLLLSIILNLVLAHRRKVKNIPLPNAELSQPENSDTIENNERRTSSSQSEHIEISPGVRLKKIE